jgi:hypothetical protein
MTAVEQASNGPESEPIYLYRYFAKQWAESLLLKGKMFFPCPADFNDPFDCRAQVTFDSRTKRQRYARELARSAFRICEGTSEKGSRKKLKAQGRTRSRMRDFWSGFMERRECSLFQRSTTTF